MSSPFTPHLGTVPKVFVGRDLEIGSFKTILNASSRGKPASILLTGHRGSGKTVLLKYFSSVAKEMGFFSVYIGLDEGTATPYLLSQKIYGKVKATLEEIVVSLKAKKLLKQLKPSMTVKLDELELQIGASLSDAEINENNFPIALGKIIKGRNIAVFTDETQSVLRNGTARFIVNTLYSELPEYARRWVFILAGTPILEEKILRATPADRAFQRMNLENLSEKDVTNLLQKTVVDTGVDFTKDACALIAGDTQGLPFYVQFFGDVLFNTISKGKITKGLYLRNRSKVINALGEAVFKTRTNDLERRGIYYDVLIKIAILDKDDGVSAKDISKNLSTYVGPYICELENKGFIKKISRGKYRVSDNLYKDWLVRSGSSEEK